MQILDPTSGLSITVDLPTGNRSTRAASHLNCVAQVPAVPRILSMDEVRFDSGLRTRNASLSWSSGNRVRKKNNIPLRYHRYYIHYYWESARHSPGQKP